MVLKCHTMTNGIDPRRYSLYHVQIVHVCADCLLKLNDSYTAHNSIMNRFYMLVQAAICSCFMATLL